MTFRLLLRGLFVPLWRCTGKNSTSGFSLRFHAFAQQTSSLHLSPITLKAKDRGKSGKHKKVTIDESEINEVIDIQVYKISLENAISDLKQSFAKDLALRTSIGSIDSIPVNFEGDSYPLSELAKIGMKSNNVVVINMSSFPQKSYYSDYNVENDFLQDSLLRFDEVILSGEDLQWCWRWESKGKEDKEKWPVPIENFMKELEPMLKRTMQTIMNTPPFRQSLPMPWWSSLSSGVETITDNEEVFQVELDVKGFKPEDINVKVRDREVHISGQHDSREDQGNFVSRRFHRTYYISEGIVLGGVSCRFDEDRGILTVTAPKKDSESQEQTRKVKVEIDPTPSGK